MTMTNNSANNRPTFATAEDVSITQLQNICSQTVDINDYSFAERCEKNVLIYHCSEILKQAKLNKPALLAQLHHALSDAGPGVVVIKNAYTDTRLLEQHNRLFEQILEREALHQTGGDHFAAAGSNGRIWNALQKVAIAQPSLFIDYYKNPILPIISDAWLGPYWQITSQVNIVRPGASAQQPHRDYHLGFQNPDVCARYPLDVHKMSSQLTLQGAIAHTDMPIETGPTQLLPFSHQYDLVYLAWRNPEVIELFKQDSVQLPLKQGDALFFNPALFHSAGENQTCDVHRSANLLQVSSAFGKTMESVDRSAMTKAIYPQLKYDFDKAQLSIDELSAIIACTADGYSFPTNLDLDPPTKEMAPETMQALLKRALLENWKAGDIEQQLDDKHRKRLA